MTELKWYQEDIAETEENIADLGDIVNIGRILYI